MKANYHPSMTLPKSYDSSLQLRQQQERQLNYPSRTLECISLPRQKRSSPLSAPTSVHANIVYDTTIDDCHNLGKHYGDDSYDILSDDDLSCMSSLSQLEKEEEQEDNIYCHVVYALHIFIATVEGQVSVMRGDRLVLLDDTNAYWWLVRIVKTSDIGYIPAENIETPFERLARFNKYRNTEIIPALPSSKEDIHCKRTSNKKVTISKNVSIQSLIITTDEYNTHIMETFQESQGDVDNPLSAPSQAENSGFVQSPTRLSNHALSVGIAQHFVELHRAARYQSLHLPPSSSSAIERKGITPTLRQLLSRSKYIPSSNLPAVPSSSSFSISGNMVSMCTTATESSPSPSLPTATTIPPAYAQEQLSVLRVFAGNISVKATFNSVLVNENTTAEQLLLLSLERFRLLGDHQQQQIEYYLTVKVVDGDEITLAPQDKPLAIFHSLNTHLTTPMPSLTHIRAKVQLTRIGVSKSMTTAQSSFGENSVIRFSLHKRIKRVSEKDGQVRIKIAYYTDSIVTARTPVAGPSSNLRFSPFHRRWDTKPRSSSQCSFTIPSSQLMDRIEKLVAVPGNMVVSELTSLALDKFHIQQGVPYTSTNEKMDKYGMTLVVQEKEHLLNGNRSIMDILDDEWLNAKGSDDRILFVIRKMQSRVLSPFPPDDEGCTMTITSHQDLCGSTLSSTSTSSASTSSSSSPSSSSSSTSSSSSASSACEQQHLSHGKLSTDALLHRIDLALLSLEKNISVNSPTPTWFPTSLITESSL